MPYASFRLGALVAKLTLPAAALLLIAGISAPASAQSGFQGSWHGTYVCSQGPTGLTLSITEDAPGRLRAQFRTHAVPGNPSAPESEFEMAGRYNARTGQIRLRPVRWIKKPAGNWSMVGLNATLAADGQRLQGAIAFRGCGAFTLARANGATPRQAAPAQPAPVAKRPAASHADAGRAPIVGEWEGSATCGRTRYDVVLDVSALPSGDFHAQLVHLGPNALSTNATPLKLVARFNASENSYLFVPERSRGSGFSGQLSAGDDQLSITSQQCGTFTVQRATERSPSRVPSVALPQNGGTYRETDPLDARCEALIAWAQRISREHPDLDVMRTVMGKLHPIVVRLYADDDFVPVFGTTYDRATFDRQSTVLQDLRTNCARDPFIRQKGGWIWGFGALQRVAEDRNSYRGSFSPGAIVHTVRQIRRIRNELKSDQGAGAGGDFETRARQLESARERLASRSAYLWPSEIGQHERVLSARKAALSKDVVGSWLSEMKALAVAPQNFAVIPKGLASHAAAIDALPAAEKLAVHRQLALKMNDLLAAQEAAPAGLQPSAEFLSQLKTLDRLAGSGDESFRRDSRERIGRVVASLVSKRLPEIGKHTGTLEGLTSYTAWRADFQRDFGAFTQFEAVKSANDAVAAKARTLGAEVTASIGKDLSGASDLPSLLRVQAAIASLDRNVKDNALSRPLWTDYEASVDRWIQRSLDSAAKPRAPATPSSSTANPASQQNPLGGFSSLPAGASAGQGGSAFHAPGLAEPRIVKAIHEKNFGLIYKENPKRVRFYLMNFIGGVNQACPGVAPTDVSVKAMQAELGLDIRTTDRDAIARLGFERMKQTLESLAQPGKMFSQAFEAQAIQDRAHGDVRRIVQSVGCDSPAWRTFFGNLGAYFQDPTDGIDPADLDLATLCARKQPSRFCQCAGPVMERTLTDPQKKFVRLDIAENMSVARKLLPKLERALGSCR